MNGHGIRFVRPPPPQDCPRRDDGAGCSPHTSGPRHPSRLATVAAIAASLAGGLVLCGAAAAAIIYLAWEILAP
jgi:hypothetical protein